jgi:hypothetical protein
MTFLPSCRLNSIIQKCVDVTLSLGFCWRVCIAAPKHCNSKSLFPGSFTQPACWPHEGLILDGRFLDGRSLDGRSFDGRSLAGRSLEGRSLDGRSFDGRSLDGMLCPYSLTFGPGNHSIVL